MTTLQRNPPGSAEVASQISLAYDAQILWWYFYPMQGLSYTSLQDTRSASSRQRLAIPSMYRGPNIVILPTLKHHTGGIALHSFISSTKAALRIHHRENGRRTVGFGMSRFDTSDDSRFRLTN